MTISEKLMGVGSWSLTLSANTPWWVRDRLNVSKNGFGHIVVLPTHVGVTSISDANKLSMARYVGIFRDEPGRLQIGGPGLYAWITDEDGKYHAPSTAWTTAGGTFAQWAAVFVNALPFTAGITSSVAGTGVKTYTAQTPLNQVMNEIVVETFGAEYRINTNFTIDIGTQAALYTTTPQTVVVSRAGDGGRDLAMLGIVGDLDFSRDLDDWFRTVRYWYGPTPTLVTYDGSVAAANVPFRYPDGTAIEMGEVITDSQTTTSTMAGLISAGKWGVAQQVHQEIRITTNLYDVGRDVKVGDSMWVYAPELGLVNTSNQVPYRGEIIFPQSLRCVGLTYPVRRGMGVYFRRAVSNGTSTWPIEWTDLTPYVEFEDGDATVEVASKPRKIGM